MTLLQNMVRKLGLLLLLLSGLAQAASLTDESMAVDGRQRRFLVHDFSGPAPAPLVILLHGGGGSGENMAQQTGFDAVAEREGLIAVYPYGSNGVFENILLTWNAGHCCAYAMRENVDDVRFISLLIDRLVAAGAADPERIYVTGLSNGGMMTHRLGRELPHKIAAIAPVISSLFGDEPLQQSVLPTLIINGADDRIVRVEGGELGVSLLLGAINGNNTADRAALPVASQGEYWAAVNGCTTITDTSSPLWERRNYGSCRETGIVQSYLIRNNGHAWPGGTAPRTDADQPVQAVSANELIWDFFRQHRRKSSNALAPFYYDEQLNIPAFLTSGRAYSAVLALLPGLPRQFELKKLVVPDAAATAGGNVYQQGVLTLPRVIVGSQQYRATLNVLGTNPTRLGLLDLTRIE